MTARHRWDIRHRRPASESETPCGWDDPVPSVASADVLAPTPLSHDVECAVRRQLVETSGLRFSSLVIRRVHDGVCLQGVLEVDDDAPDLSRLARQVEGVNCVIDQVVVHQTMTAGATCC